VYFPGNSKHPVSHCVRQPGFLKHAGESDAVKCLECESRACTAKALLLHSSDHKEPICDSKVYK
jgi:hypothetical protein